MKKDKQWVKDEATKKIQNLFNISEPNYFDFESTNKAIRSVIDQLDEPEVLSQELPVIPEFVAEWIETNRERYENKFFSIGYDLYSNAIHPDVDDWLVENEEKFVRAWLDGYTVEEEQKYIVKLPLPGNKTNDFAVVDIYGDIWLDDEWPSQCKMTEKEIKALPKGEAYFEHFAVKVEEMEEND